ncbi:hypothetical protein FOT62_27650 [Serratia marcescens]|uniref:Lipoprotein n=1 Tax=Serratia marcescens TaxID=615 RepID=A0A5C7BLI2_SERMA|nr:hypothetical protein [Serratia marcescens]TXE21695.1 hypothetical protein FOT62_27650 [Serratia marcescens]TXE57170.1 hypothetical protein FOT56_23450 [Serratia marcescens]
MRSILFSPFLLMLSSCALNAEFIPDEGKLNDATVGIPYYNRITILGGHVVSDYSRVVGDIITPTGEFVTSYNGIHLQPCDGDAYNSNCIEVRGTPKKTSLLTIRIIGGVSGGMFSHVAKFDKTYTVEIKAAD